MTNFLFLNSLNFPSFQVGPIVAALLPVPVALFDSRLPSPGSTCLKMLVGQLVLKFIFGNIIEVKLIEHDKILRMHPLIILMSVALFGYIWGPTGENYTPNE